MRKRIAAIISATVLCAATVAVVGTAEAAHATNGPQIVSTAAGTLALNSQFGDHSPSSYVIAYNLGNTNNTYELQHLTGICNGGYVENQDGLACPFADGSGLNNRYAGDAIVQIIDYDTVGENPPLCVAASTSGAGVEGGCSTIDNNFGWGGASGSVFVLSAIKNFPNLGTTPFWAVNYYYTNMGICGANTAAWMVSGSISAPVYLNSCTANNQFYESP